MEVQAVRGHPWGCVGVLLSPPGVDESQAGVPRAGGVEEVDQGVAPHGVVAGLLFTAAIVEVFIGASVEAFSRRRLPRVVVVGEGVAWPVVPMPRRCVRHRQAARVAVSQLGDAQRDDVAWRDCIWTWAAPGARDGVVQPHSRGGQGPEYAVDPDAPR